MIEAAKVRSREDWFWGGVVTGKPRSPIFGSGRKGFAALVCIGAASALLPLQGPGDPSYTLAEAVVGSSTMGAWLFLVRYPITVRDNAFGWSAALFLVAWGALRFTPESEPIVNALVFGVTGGFVMRDMEIAAAEQRIADEIRSAKPGSTALTTEPGDKAIMSERRLPLYHQTGATKVWIDVYVRNTGDIVVDGQDIGEAPEHYWGDSEYEYWSTVAAKDADGLLTALLRDGAPPAFDRLLEGLTATKTYTDIDLTPLWDRVSPAAVAAVVPLDCKEREKLILALIKDRFDADPGAVSRFQDFCRDHDVMVNFNSWV
jgi:hypothetical protein